MGRINKIENIISYSILLFGVMANLLGFVTCFNHFDPTNIDHIANMLFSGSSFIIVLLFTILAFLIPSKITTFTYFMILFTAFTSFPTILFTSKGLAFIPYLGIQGVLFGITSKGKTRNLIIGILPLILDIVLMYLKVKMEINLGDDGQLKSHLLTLAMGISTSYLFNLFVTFVSMKGIYTADKDKYLNISKSLPGFKSPLEDKS